MPTQNQVSMLTFAPMIDSEFCRFLLTHYGVNYSEERYMVWVVALIAYLRNRSTNIPLVQGPGFKLVGPKALCDHYEPLAAPAGRLVPAADRDQIENDFHAITANSAPRRP